MSHQQSGGRVSLTEGSIVRGILAFAIPLFFGQLLQQLYNMVDAWVIGNFADNDSFAAVTSTGTVVFLIIGFFSGIAIGGSVIISRYFGADDKENVSRAIHTNFLMAVIASILATVTGLLLTPHLLRWLGTPASVMPNATIYLKIYFGGVSTVILYNVCMSIMRALGDSIHPLYYLLFSSVINILLDLLFVVHPAFRWGVRGTAAATVISQGISVVLCLRRMCHSQDYTRFEFRKLRLLPRMMIMVLQQGLPSGLQNAVITVGNLVIQKNINSFGAYAMSGQGAYSKIEGLVFLPIMSMAMALPTFISQNLGAGKYNRAKKGALFGILFGVVTAELTGVLIRLFTEPLLRIFLSESESIRYGVIHGHTVSLFFFLLAFSHCAAGVMRGCGKAVVPMAGMLLSWCLIRITYVTVALKFFPVYRTISWAYPLTWSITSVLFLIYLLRVDWKHVLKK
ncbi:MAG: MATE family efflux transporter [Lachnospiraceae bacterium]|nr:MATE family efflux transporter [Lachnospiraceae bacterium]